MKILSSKTIIVLCIFLSISFILTACSNAELEKQKEYDKCTAVCAAIVDETGEDALVTLEICRNECKKKFLD